MHVCLQLKLVKVLPQRGQTIAPTIT